MTAPPSSCGIAGRGSPSAILTKVSRRDASELVLHGEKLPGNVPARPARAQGERPRQEELAPHQGQGRIRSPWSRGGHRETSATERPYRAHDRRSESRSRSSSVTKMNNRGAQVNGGHARRALMPCPVSCSVANHGFAPLTTLAVALASPQKLGPGPLGTRVIVPITAGHFTGPDLHHLRNALSAVQTRRRDVLKWTALATFPGCARAPVAVRGRSLFRTLPRFELLAERPKGELPFRSTVARADRGIA